MYKNLVLPNSLQGSLKKAHEVFTFNGNDYMNLLPFVLYRINGLIYYDTELTCRVYKSAVWVGEEGHTLVEMFHPKEQKWVEVEQKCIDYVSKKTIEYYMNKYDGFLSIDNDDYNKYLKFDTSAWAKKTFNELIEVDLYKAIVWVKGIEHKYNINTLKYERDNLCDEDTHMMFRRFEDIDQYVRYLTEEFSVINFESHYETLYNDVKSGKLSFEDFIKLV